MARPAVPPSKTPYTFIDLFCGCGGFTLGMLRAGFKCLAAIDFNQHAIDTLTLNLKERKDDRFPPVEHPLFEDLTSYSPKQLEKLIGTDHVDVIVGGPPCQGFSTARQVDGSNHGERLKEDNRRHLYHYFLKFVKHFRPTVFVMENVLGIRTAAGGTYYGKVQSEARELGYRVHAMVENARDLGVPQKRRRQLFIGTRADTPGYFEALRRSARATKEPTLWQAIGDLPRLAAGEGDEVCPYDMQLRANFKEKHDSRYLFGVLEVTRAESLTSHRARPHSPRDIGDFKKLAEGESSAVAMDRGVKFDHPYDTSSFRDRYTRQHRNRPCSTIVAHLSKDGLMFIHPTQDRSLTPREAARVQSFPDWFQFPVARTHQFRLIGNAVPPLIAEAVGNAAKSYLERAKDMSTDLAFLELAPLLPESQQEAVDWLTPLVLAADRNALKKLTDKEFKRGWFSVSYLFPGLHPDGTTDHGELTAEGTREGLGDDVKIAERIYTPYFVETGWPVALAPIVKEAWRRYDLGKLEDNEIYCCDAQVAGMIHGNPELIDEVKAGRGVLM